MFTTLTRIEFRALEAFNWLREQAQRYPAPWELLVATNQFKKPPVTPSPAQRNSSYPEGSRLDRSPQYSASLSDEDPTCMACHAENYGAPPFRASDGKLKDPLHWNLSEPFKTRFDDVCPVKLPV